MIERRDSFILSGWWGQPAGYRGNRTVIFKLSIETQFGSGKTFIVTNAQNWLGKNGPITFDGIYDGETYDARYVPHCLLFFDLEL